jgi:DNA-binding HxlR family transcriptional regulator
MSKNRELPNREHSEELVRLIEDFKERIHNGTSTANSFLTISEIEQLWSELRGNTSKIYSDMLSDLLSSVDESDLIRKKKLNTNKKGSSYEPIKDAPDQS